MKFKSIVFLTILLVSNILSITAQQNIKEINNGIDIQNFKVEELYQLISSNYMTLFSYYLIEVDMFIHYFLPFICILVILSYLGLIGKKINLKQRKGSFNISDNEEDKLLKNSL